MTNQVTFPANVGGDGSTVTDDSNPSTGLANGGFRTRLLPMFTNIINVVNWMIAQANALVGQAGTSASAAAASAATALNAPGTSATSTTSLTVGVGAQNLTIQAGKQIVVGMFVVVASTASPANWMHGNVTAYNSVTGALTVQVDSVGGSGTIANWTISMSGVSAATPPQAGNAGKFLQTNGTTTNWGFPGITTVVATVTASTTLANGTGYLYVPAQTTAYGQAVTLPAANSLTTGPNFAIDNSKGSYPVGIRDNTGTLLMGVAAGGVASVSLKDNSTVAGIWSIHGTNLEPGLVSIDTTLSTTYIGSANNDFTSGVFLALNNNQSLHFVSNAARTAFYAYIVDSVGKQVTTPTLVASGLASVCRVQAVFAVSSTSAIVFYSDSNNANNAVVLSISGTTITVGSPATIAGSLSTGLYPAEDGYTGPRIAQLSPTLYVATSANNASNGWTAVAAFSVSGMTITTGAVASIATAYGQWTTVYALTATTALVIYTTGSASPFTVYAVVVSVSGTTCTVGAAVSPPTGTYVATLGRNAQPFSCLLTPTTALVVTDGAGVGTLVIPYVITISGTTVSFGSQVVLETGVAGFSSNSGYSDNGGSRFAPHLLPLTATTAFLWYVDGSGISRSLVLTVSGSTYSAGATLYGSISFAPSASVSYGVVLPYSASEFLSVRQRATAAGTYSSILQPSKINGTTITTGYGKALTEFGPTALSTFMCNRLSGGDYVLGSQSPPAPLLSVFRNNGDAINSRGNISIPPLALTATNGCFQNGVVASNRMVLIGSTVQSASSSAGAAQTRILSVEIAA